MFVSRETKTWLKSTSINTYKSILDLHDDMRIVDAIKWNNNVLFMFSALN